MPRQRITKEMVVEAAFEIARNRGMEQMTIKNISEKIGCSVQPIYSYCDNMEGLHREVMDRARDFARAYAAAHTDRNDLFRSTGRAYIRLAKEEPNIFKMFILRERGGVASLEELYRAEAGPDIARRIGEELGIGPGQAKRLHLNMMIYTIGLGTIFSVTTPGIMADEILAQQETAYAAFLKQALAECRDGVKERDGDGHG